MPQVFSFRYGMCGRCHAMGVVCIECDLQCDAITHEENLHSKNLYYAFYTTNLLRH